VVEAFLAVSFVRTLVLLAVAAGLGAWLWLVEAPKVEEEAKAGFLLDFDPAAVEKLRLAYPNGTEIAFVREGEDWKMTAPVSYLAENSVVENFFQTIRDTKIERRLEAAEAGGLASYGLEGERGSQARIELTLKDGKPLPAVVLGIATPVGYQAFARREGSDEVLVIPLLLQSSAVKTPLDVRRKAMLPGSDSTGVRKVRIEKPGSTIELERRGESQWAMTAPVSDAADVEAVRSMLDSMATIDAIGFYDGDEVDRKAFGLETGTGTRVRAEKDDGSAVEFTVGNEAPDPPAGNYFERASDGQVAKAPDWVAKKFSPEPNELRQRRLLSCRLDEIRRLTWTVGGETFTIAREEHGKPWSITPEVAGQVLNQRIVDNAVQGLVAARADAVVGDAATLEDLARFDLDKPTVSLDVEGRSGPCAALVAGPAPTTLIDETASGRPQGTKTYVVKDDSRSAVLRASEHEFSRLAMKRPAFVEAAPAEGGGAAPGGAPAPG
jgi:hypothetical protein